MKGVSHSGVVAGYQVPKDHYTQWGQPVKEVAPKDTPNTQGPDPLGAWANFAPPAQTAAQQMSMHQ